MSDYVQITTSAEVYAVIFARHRDQLSAFETFSDPDGTFNGGPGEIGRMVTTWGIKGCDWPLIGIRTIWDIDPEKPAHRRNEEHSYWLCLPKREDV
jgi:hypothetical protein